MRDMRDNVKITQLIDAVESGDLLSVKKLISKRSSNVSLADELGDTPLLRASLLGSVDIVKLLLESGADPNMCNPYKYLSPLLVAVRSRNLQIVKLLLLHGADVHYVDGHKLPILFHCMFHSDRSDLPIFELLIRHGADVHFMLSECTSLLEHFEEWPHYDDMQQILQNQKEKTDNLDIDAVIDQP